MKKIFVLLALASAVTMAGCRDRQQTQSGNGTKTESVSEEEAATIVKVGKKAPNFTVTMLDGTEYKLSDLKGKVVMLNFWATWCPPCRMEFARLQADVVDRFAGKDFVMIALSREEAKETVEKFMEAMGYEFNVGLDPEREVYSKYASNYIPRNFIINKKGRVALASTGYEPEEFDRMIGLIDDLLGK